MADDGSGQFGSGLNFSGDQQPPAPPQSSDQQPQSGGFGGSFLGPHGSLFGPRYDPAPSGSSPLDAAENQLRQQSQRAQWIATNPWAQIFGGADEARQAIPQIAEKWLAIQQQKQHQIDIQQRAVNQGLRNPGQFGAAATDDTLANEQLRQWKEEGSYNAYLALQGTSPEWAARANLYAPEAIGQLQQHIGAVQKGLTALNAAAQSRDQQAYDSVRNGLNDQDWGSIGLKPGQVPQKVDDWKRSGAAITAKYNNADRMVSNFFVRQNQLGQAVPITDEKVAGRIEGSYQFSNSEQIPGFKAVTLPGYGDQQGTMGPPGSKDINNFGKTWNIASPDQIKTVTGQLGTEEVKGLLSKYKASRDFEAAANNPDMYKSAAGIADLYDTVGGVVRDVVEGTKAAGNVGLTRQFEARYGTIDKARNAIANEWAALKEWNGKPSSERLAPPSIEGIKMIARFQHQQMMQEASERLNQPFKTAGRYGMNLEDLGLSKELTGDPQLLATYNSAVAGSKREIAGYPMVAIGDRRVNLPTGSRIPGATTAAPIQESGDTPYGRDHLAAGSASGPAGGGGNVVAPSVIGAWRGQGMSDNGIAGIMHNIREESNFDPGLRHPDQPRWGGEAHFAHGLYQEGGAEWNNYTQWLGQNAPGKDWRDPALQSQFAAQNLKNNYPATWQRMNTAATPEDAARIYAREYLKPSTPNLQNRLDGIRKNGVASLESYGTGTAPSGGLPALPKPTAPSLFQRLMSGNVPGGRATTEAARQDVREEGPAIGSTLGAIGGAVGGPPGMAAGGLAGGVVGQGAKDFLNRNTPQPLEYLKQGGLGLTQAIAPEGRPIVGALARAAGAGVVEGGTKAVEGGDADSIAGAAITGAGSSAVGSAAGEATGVLGRFVGFLGREAHQFVSRFTKPEQQKLFDQGAKLTDANKVLKEQEPKLPATAQGAALDNPKYVQAEKDAADATAELKAGGHKPDDIAYAVDRAREGATIAEAQIGRPLAAEKAAAVQEYQAKRRELETAAARAAQIERAGAPTYGKGTNSMPIRDATGKQVGDLDFSERDDAIRVTYPHIDPASQKQGLAVTAYSKLADYGLSQGKPLISDTAVTDAASNVYGALERRGYTVERNPNTRPGFGGVTHSTDGQPVYKITASPGSGRAIPDGPVSLINTADNPKGTITSAYEPEATTAQRYADQPAANPAARWANVEKAQSLLLGWERNAYKANDPDRAEVMRTMATSLRGEQRRIASSLLPESRVDPFMDELHATDKRYATVMQLSDGIKQSKLSTLLSKNTPESREFERNFRQIAAGDPTAIAALNAVKADARHSLGQEGKILGLLGAADLSTVLAGNPLAGATTGIVAAKRFYDYGADYLRARMLGRKVKFADFFANEAAQNSPLPGAIGAQIGVRAMTQAISGEATP
jgi:hypothetical protein